MAESLRDGLSVILTRHFRVVVLRLEGMTEVVGWADELESGIARVVGRFARADLRWRVRDYVRGLLGQAARKNGWQLAEWTGHRTPDGFQRLLNSSV